MISLKKIENFYFNLIFIKKKRLKHFHQNKFKVWSQHYFNDFNYYAEIKNF